MVNVYEKDTVRGWVDEVGHYAAVVATVVRTTDLPATMSDTTGAALFEAMADGWEPRDLIVIKEGLIY